MTRTQLDALIRILVNHGFIVNDNPAEGYCIITEPTRCITVDSLRVTDYAGALIDLIPDGYIYKSGYQTVTIG